MTEIHTFPRISIIALAAWLGCCADASAAILTYDFTFTFTGTAPTAPAPWLRASFADADGGVTLQVTAPGLSAGENISGIYFNLDPLLAPAMLNFAHSGGMAANSISTGVNAFKADGDGKYDILFGYGTGMSGLMAGGTSSYQISGTGLTAASFFAVSSPGSASGGTGNFFAAAHVQNTGGGGSSGWVAATAPSAVPVPGALALLAVGLVTVGGFVRRTQAG